MNPGPFSLRVVPIVVYSQEHAQTWSTRSPALHPPFSLICARLFIAESPHRQRGSRSQKPDPAKKALVGHQDQYRNSPLSQSTMAPSPPPPTEAKEVERVPHPVAEATFSYHFPIQEEQETCQDPAQVHRLISANSTAIYERGTPGCHPRQCGFLPLGIRCRGDLTRQSHNQASVLVSKDLGTVHDFLLRGTSKCQVRHLRFSFL